MGYDIARNIGFLQRLETCVLPWLTCIMTCNSLLFPLHYLSPLLNPHFMQCWLYMAKVIRARLLDETQLNPYSRLQRCLQTLITLPQHCTRARRPSKPQGVEWFKRSGTANEPLETDWLLLSRSPIRARAEVCVNIATFKKSAQRSLAWVTRQCANIHFNRQSRGGKGWAHWCYPPIHRGLSFCSSPLPLPCVCGRMFHR